MQEDSHQDLSRRRLVKGTSGLIAGGLAGCLGGDDSGEEGNGREEGEEDLEIVADFLSTSTETVEEGEELVIEYEASANSGVGTDARLEMGEEVYEIDPLNGEITVGYEELVDNVGSGTTEAELVVETETEDGETLVEKDSIQINIDPEDLGIGLSLNDETKIFEPLALNYNEDVGQDVDLTLITPSGEVRNIEGSNVVPKSTGTYQVEASVPEEDLSEEVEFEVYSGIEGKGGEDADYSLERNQENIRDAANAFPVTGDSPNERIFDLELIRILASEDTEENNRYISEESNMFWPKIEGENLRAFGKGGTEGVHWISVGTHDQIDETRLEEIQSSSGAEKITKLDGVPIYETNGVHLSHPRGIEVGISTPPDVDNLPYAERFIDTMNGDHPSFGDLVEFPSTSDEEFVVSYALNLPPEGSNYSERTSRGTATLFETVWKPEEGVLEDRAHTFQVDEENNNPYNLGDLVGSPTTLQYESDEKIQEFFKEFG